MFCNSILTMSMAKSGRSCDPGVVVDVVVEVDVAVAVEVDVPVAVAV